MNAARTRSDVLIELHVPDIKRAKRFYARFGFRVVREEDARAGDGYLVLRRGASVMCFWGGTAAVRAHPYFGRFGRVSKRGYGVEIVIPVADIAASYRVARASRCVVEELRRREWGARDFRAEDPFGFYLRFTEPYPIAARSAARPAVRRPVRVRARRAPRARSSRPVRSAPSARSPRAARDRRPARRALDAAR